MLDVIQLYNKLHREICHCDLSNFNTGYITCMELNTSLLMHSDSYSNTGIM